MISKELLIKALGNRWIDATSDRTVEEKFTLTPTGNYILFGYKGYNHWNDSINTYELAVRLKKIIEQYAKDIGLRGVWIDLNDLSKDENCYFRHCNEVYENLIQYEKQKLLG